MGNIEDRTKLAIGNMRSISNLKSTSWDRTFMKMAQLIAEHSSCVKYKVGALLVKDNRPISMGYNGTPVGCKNCSEVFTKVDMTDPKMREKHHEWSDLYEIHAEQNCLMFAGRYVNDEGFQGSKMYVTLSPCRNCLKLIIAAGIKDVYYLEDYARNDVDDYKDLPVNLHKVVLED